MDKAVVAKCITPEFRVSFPYLFTPQEPMKKDVGKKPKFVLDALFPVGADLSALKNLAMKVAVERWGADQTKWPKEMRSPFKQQGEKERDGYVSGGIYIKPWSYDRPGLVDANLQPIINPADFYAGCYARASVQAFAYPKQGVTGQSPGIGFYLANVQKTRDGESLSGRMKAEDEFEPVANPEGQAQAAPASAADIFG